MKEVMHLRRIGRNIKDTFWGNRFMIIDKENSNDINNFLLR